MTRNLARSAQKVGAQFTGDLLGPDGPYYGENYGADVRGRDPFKVCATCTWHPFWGYGLIDVHAALLGPPPYVTKVTPTTAHVGDTLTITGEDVGAATGVAIGGGTTSTITSPPNETTIKVTVPSGATSGPIAVTAPGGTSAQPFAFRLAPRIDSVGPPVAAGGSIVVTGSGLAGATALKIGAVSVAGPVSNGAGTQLTGTVPTPAPSGKVTVVTPVGTATSLQSFVAIRQAPTVTSLVPSAAAEGATVTIGGANLDSATAVKFPAVAGGTVLASPITVVSASSIRVTVPAGAASGTVVVENPLGSGTIGSFRLAPKITGLSAHALLPGGTLTLGGSGFALAGAVKFGALSIAPTSVNAWRARRSPCRCLRARPAAR